MTQRRRTVRDVILALVIPLSLLLGLTAWGFASPVSSSPDDDYHMASIWCAQGPREGLCEAGSTPDTRMVPRVLIDSHICFAFHPQESAACAAGLSENLIETDRGNFNNSYPPVYYAVMSVFASENIPFSILLMRFVNALLLVGLATALFLLLRPSQRSPLVWGALTTMVPLGVFLVPSVNPSSWSVTSAIVLWLSLVGFFTASSRTRRIGLAAIAVVATLMASGARTDSAAYSGVAAIVAVVMSFERSRRFALSLLLPIALIVIAFLFFRSTGQSEIINPDVPPAADLQYLFQLDLVLLPELWAGVLGTWGLGWLDTDMPGVVWVSMIAVAGAMLFWGLRRWDLRKALGLGIAFAALVVVPMYILVHDRVIIGAYVQPRYIFPLVIMVCMIAVYGFARADMSLGTPQIALLVFLVCVANAAALHTNLRRYVTGSDRGGPNLDSGLEWWWNLPFGPLWVWGIGTVAFSVAVIGLVVVARRSSALSSLARRPAPALDI